MWWCRCVLAVCFNDVWYALVCDIPYYDTKISHTNYVGFQHTNNEGYSVITKHSSDEKTFMAVSKHLENSVTQDASAVFIAVNFFYFVFHVSFVHLFAQIQTFRAQQQV